MSIYEEKMPSYLAMSRADLIAEILSAVDTYDKWFKHHLEKNHETPISTEARDARERVRVANLVLTERFHLEIMADDIDHFDGLLGMDE